MQRHGRPSTTTGNPGVRYRAVFAVPPDPVHHRAQRRCARADSRRAGLRQLLHRSHGRHRMGPRAGLARCPGPRLWPAGAGSGRLGAALRPGDLRGHQGLPPCRRFDLDLPSGRQRQAPAALGAAPGAAGAAGGPVRRIAAAADRGRCRVGAVGAGDQPVLPPLHDRQRGVPGRARGAEGRLLRHRQSGRRLLRQGRGAGGDLAVHRLRARGQGRHRRGQVRRQLRRLAAAAAAGAGAGLLAGAVPGPGRGQVPGRAGRHERVPGDARRQPGHPGAVRQHPRGHHPRQHPAAGARSRHARGRAPGDHRRVARRRGLR